MSERSYMYYGATSRSPDGSSHDLTLNAPLSLTCAEMLCLLLSFVLLLFCLFVWVFFLFLGVFGGDGVVVVFCYFVWFGLVGLF